MYQMQNQNMAFNPNPSYAAYQYNPMQRFQQPEPQIPQMQPQFLGIQGYLADDLRGKFLDRVLCHELCHAFCLSYNVYMGIDTEEIVADFLTTYGREVFEIADRLLIELMEVA